MTSKNLERVKFYFVKKTKNDREYCDVIMECDGFKFELDLKDYYSGKTRQLYSQIMWHLRQGH